VTIVIFGRSGASGTRRSLVSGLLHVGFSLLTLFPGRVGGSETNVRGLLGAFAAGHGPSRVTVLANRHVMAAYRGGGPVALHEVRSYRPGDRAPTRLAAMLTARAAPGVAARDVPRGLDVVHHPVTVPIPRLPGVPTVTTVFDVQHHELPGLFGAAERRFRGWAYDAAARAADVVVTSSAHSRDGLVRFAGVDPGRVAVIALGIDHGRFRPSGPALAAEVEARLPRRFVVYPANLWPHKNHARLVEALGRASARDVGLVLTGQDYGRLDALRAAARRAGVADRVVHLGYLPAAEVPALYRRATAMVFPSRFEGFGSPPLEAMACGLPVAASRAGSLGEVVADAALAFDPLDAAAIADAIDRVAGDEGLRERLRDAGLRRAASFTWERAAREHVAAYERARDAATSQ
jgi:glycosyltransferase involved in cell wall biosynthesis